MLKKIVIFTFLIILLLGGFLSFSHKVLAQNPPTPSSSKESNSSSGSQTIIEQKLQETQNQQNWLYEKTKILKDQRTTISNDDFLSIYRTAVNTKNNLRENYMILAQLGYNQNYWQKNYDRSKILVIDISDELVIIKNNDYRIQMVDSENPEIKYEDYQVKAGTTAEEKKKREAEIAARITAQQQRSQQEAKEKSGKTKDNKFDCPMGDIPNTDWFEQVIRRIECLIVDSILKIMTAVQNILSKIPI